MAEEHVERPGFRRFTLNRLTDSSGVSGTGIVCEGVKFTDGTVVLRWLGEWPTSTVVHNNGMAAVKHIHGHQGDTRIVWIDPSEGPPR